MFGNRMKHCLVFASLISPSKMILFEFVKNTPLRVVFSTLFSVFHPVMKHCVSCLIYYVKTWQNLYNWLSKYMYVNIACNSKLKLPNRLLNTKFCIIYVFMKVESLIIKNGRTPFKYNLVCIAVVSISFISLTP